MKRFRAEATTLAKLNHPEIATIYEIFRSDTDLLMVMELVRGETLDHLSQRSGPLPPERAAYLVAQVLGALGHAHQAGIVHRDLKPANIMVTELGGIKIMDFGIARVAGAEHLTSDGHMMGTPAYMAPEQVMAKEVDGRADLYSCGVVFYRLLTGTLPFQADTAIGMVQKQLSEAPTPAHVHRADLPAWCETLLDRALAKSPADRFQTAEEFRAALISAIGSVATEHTGAYAAAHLSGGTPASVPMPAATVKGPDPRPTARPVAPPKGGAPAEGATIVLQRNHFAMAGVLLAVVAVGVAVLAFVALRRPAQVSPEPAGTTQTEQASPAPAGATDPSAPANPGAASAVGSPAPQRTDAGATPGSPATSQAVAGPAATASRPAAATRGGDAGNAPKTARQTDGASAPAAAARTTSARAAAAESTESAATKEPATPFVFDAKAVVVEGGKNRERDAKALLSDGKITVTEKNDSVIAAIPYGTIVGLTHSNSKQPLWNSPGGPAELVKVEGGAFGFFKGGRNWLAVRTKDTSLVLRVSDEEVRRVIAALEERTRQKVERVVESKD